MMPDFPEGLANAPAGNGIGRGEEIALLFATCNEMEKHTGDDCDDRLTVCFFLAPKPHKSLCSPSYINTPYFA